MDTPLVIRGYNLTLKAAPNFVKALTEKEIAYYENHLDELAEAIKRGFIIPPPPVQVAEDATNVILEALPGKATLTGMVDVLKDIFGWVDGDITAWFDQKTVNTESSEASTRLHRLSKTMTHGAIMNELKAKETYQEFTLLAGLKLAKQLVEAGEVNERGKGIIIYLSTRSKDGRFCSLRVCRLVDGKLFLYVHEVGPDNECNAEDGVLSSNK